MDTQENQNETMRQIRFDTFEDAIGAVGDFSDGLGCNVTITSEPDGTFMFFGHGEKVANFALFIGYFSLLAYNENSEQEFHF
jgi:hypothetical protein